MPALPATTSDNMFTLLSKQNKALGGPGASTSDNVFTLLSRQNKLLGGPGASTSDNVFTLLSRNNKLLGGTGASTSDNVFTLLSRQNKLIGGAGASTSDNLFTLLAKNQTLTSALVSPPPQAVAAGFSKLIFTDDFNVQPDIGYGTTGHKWNSGLWYQTVPSASSFVASGSILTVTDTTGSGVNLCTQYHDYSGGIQFLGGYFESRILCHCWSAFWLYQWNRPSVPVTAGNPLTYANEIDILESDPSMPSMVDTTLHYNTSGSGGIPDQTTYTFNFVPFVQQKVQANDTVAVSQTITLSANTTTGNTLIVGVISRGVSTTPSALSISGGSATFTKLIDVRGTSPSDGVAWWAAANITGGATPTITITMATATAVEIIAAEVQGPVTLTVDGTATVASQTSTSSTAMAVGPVSTVAAGDILLAGFHVGNTYTGAATPWQSFNTPHGNGFTFQVATSAGSVTANATQNTASAYSAALVSLRYTMPGGPVIGGWHTYGVLWTQSAGVSFYIDNILRFSAAPYSSTWQPVQLILGVGPGGVNGGASDVSPAYMLVDWVRVWS